MKKIFAVLLSVMMLLGMLAVTAFADESADETMIPVVVQVPEGWARPICGLGRMMVPMPSRHGPARKWTLWLRGGITPMFPVLSRTSL